MCIALTKVFRVQREQTASDFNHWFCSISSKLPFRRYGIKLLLEERNSIVWFLKNLYSISSHPTALCLHHVPELPPQHCLTFTHVFNTGIQVVEREVAWWLQAPVQNHGNTFLPSQLALHGTLIYPLTCLKLEVTYCARRFCFSIKYRYGIVHWAEEPSQNRYSYEYIWWFLAKSHDFFWSHDWQ